MLSICVDRYRAVIFPLKPKLTTRQTLIIILIIWVLALAVSLPTAIFSRVVQGAGREGEVKLFNIKVKAAWVDFVLLLYIPFVVF